MNDPDIFRALLLTLIDIDNEDHVAIVDAALSGAWYKGHSASSLGHDYRNCPYEVSENG